MEHLKACFVGVGSIAKRHIKNLRRIAGERNIDLELDVFRRQPGPVEGVDRVYWDMREVPSDYDVIFITNPTDRHLGSLRQFHDKGKHFFIEKPVVSLSQIEEAEAFETRESSVYYVACPLRYNAVIRYIRENVRAEDVLSVRSISSSYLPDWRPGQDYRETYSAHRDMGGGVSLDLIHEWDYLTYLFGWPRKISCMLGRKSALEIDSDDYAIYLAEYDDKIAEVHLDYFGRQTLREIQLFTKEETILGDIARNRITFLGSGREVNFHEERDDCHIRELEHFLDMILQREWGDKGYRRGIRVLQLTQGRI